MISSLIRSHLYGEMHLENHCPDAMFIGGTYGELNRNFPLGASRLLRFQPCSTVAAQFLHHGTMRCQGGQGGIGTLRAGELVIGIKHILPGLSLNRARLDFRQVRFLCGKNFERCDQGAWPVFHGKCQADLVRIGAASNQVAAEDTKKNACSSQDYPLCRKPAPHPRNAMPPGRSRCQRRWGPQVPLTASRSRPYHRTEQPP